MSSWDEVFSSIDRRLESLGQGIERDPTHRDYVVQDSELTTGERYQMQVLHGIKIKAKTEDVLNTLKENRQRHLRIVREAQEGFQHKAKEALEHRLAQLKEGKLVDLKFTLTPPRDYSSVYDTAISMMELSQEDTVELNHEQVRNLIQDEWDWKQDFIGVNALYSSTAAEWDNR